MNFIGEEGAEKTLKRGGRWTALTNRTALHTKRFFQAAGVEEFVILQDVPGGAVGDDPARLQNDGAAAQVQNQVQVVGGDDQGMVEGLQQLDQLPPGLGIKIGTRLIH